MLAVIPEKELSTFVTADVNANSALFCLHVANGYPYKTIVSVNLAPQPVIGGGEGLGGGLGTGVFVVFVVAGAPNDTPKFTHRAMHTTTIHRICAPRHPIGQTRLIYLMATSHKWAIEMADDP